MNIGDLITKDEKLLQGFVIGPPITDEEAAKLVIAVSGSTVTPEEIVKAKDALALIRQTNASYRQLSKVLCGKENATLDEVLQAVSKVKAELKRLTQNHIEDMKIICKLERERDAAVADLDKNHQCDICAHVDCQWDEYPCSSCLHSDPVDNVYSNFEWRGVCPENTEVQEDE